MTECLSNDHRSFALIHAAMQVSHSHPNNNGGVQPEGQWTKGHYQGKGCILKMGDCLKMGIKWMYWIMKSFLSLSKNSECQS